MTTKKSLLALAAAVTTATLLPLSALAAQGNFQGAACGSGASGNFTQTAPGGDGIFKTSSVLDTTIAGNGNQQRAGYELKVIGLKPPIDGFGWQNCQLSFNVPVGGNLTYNDLGVILHFSSGLTLNANFSQFGLNKLKPGTWQSCSFTNRDFAGQGRTSLLTRLVVYQQNSGNATTKVSFGDVNVFHFNQNGITGGQIALQDGGCNDLDLPNGPSGNIGGNSLREQFSAKSGFNPLDPRRPR